MGCKESKQLEDKKQKRTTDDVPPFIQSYPRAVPPKTTRSEILHVSDLKLLEQKVTLLPDNELDSYDSLLQYFLSDVKDEIKIAWMLYICVTMLNISQEYPPNQEADDTPRGYIRRITEGKRGLASFYTLLCRRANLRCVTIEGICKNEQYTVGLLEKDLSKLRGSWNAVYLKKSWRFVNVNFGRIADTRMRPYFFIIEPEHMKVWCHPDRKEWQLLHSPLIRREFVSLPFCTGLFFQLGLKLIQPRFGKVKAKQGKGTVDINIDRSLANSVVLQYCLSCTKHFHGSQNENNISSRSPRHGKIVGDLDTGEKERLHASVTDTFSETHSSLEKYVYMSRVDANITFDIIFPSPGIYLLDIFGKSLNERSGFCTFESVCQVKFVCYEKLDSEVPLNSEPLPHAPDIGWGPTPYCSRIGIRAVSHASSHIYYVPSEPLEMVLELQTTFKFKVEILNEDSYPIKEDCVSTHIEDKNLIVNIVIPIEGQFALKISARKTEEQNFVNVLNYLLLYNKQNGYVERFQKRMLRERLEKAMESGSEKDVYTALYDFELHNVVNQGEIIKAKDRLKYFVQKKDLREGIKRRNVRVLEKAIESAKESPYTRELEEDITKAEKTLTKLRKLEGFLHPIQRMEPTTVSEIKSYHNPLPVIKDIFTATYVILGEKYEYAKEWRCIQSLLSKTGEESLLSRILQLDTEEVSQETVQLADIILEPYGVTTAREASNGAVTFYKWAKHIVEERKSHNVSIEPLDLHLLHMEKPKQKKYHLNVKSKIDTGIKRKVYPEEPMTSSPKEEKKQKVKKEK